MKKVIFTLIIIFFLISLLFIIPKFKNKSNNDLVSLEEKLLYPFYTNVEKAKNIDSNYVLVNKYYFLGEDYTPDDLENLNSKVKLRKQAKESFINMSNDIKKENLKIIGFSGFRSYNYQKNLYDKYVKYDGIKNADTYSARPGFSEHQTGLAIDIKNSTLPYTDFEKTDEYKWMINNSYKYGFILRYPKDKENITGYIFEPWHYRYVGIEIASYIYKNNITFDEYYYKFIEKKK